MPRRFHGIRALLLTALIVVAICLRGAPARAGEDAEALVVAGGCFWCVESDFESVPGVIEAVSGFTGGDVPDPSYREVSRGKTGHFEAVRIRFDPAQVTRESLLHLFLHSIDVTDPGGQFCDRGSPYRTAIFVSGPEERALAEAAVDRAARDLGQPVVTEIRPLDRFYPAGARHQDYYQGKRLVLTRFGPLRQRVAYKRYRIACGRDARVHALWGDAAPFAAKYLDHGS